MCCRRTTMIPCDANRPPSMLCHCLDRGLCATMCSTTLLQVDARACVSTCIRLHTHTTALCSQVLTWLAFSCGACCSMGCNATWLCHFGFAVCHFGLVSLLLLSLQSRFVYSQGRWQRRAYLRPGAKPTKNVCRCTRLLSTIACYT